MTERPASDRPRADPREGNGYSEEFTHAFRKKLGASGLIGIGWPKEYGGHGKDMLFEAILSELPAPSERPKGSDRADSAGR